MFAGYWVTLRPLMIAVVRVTGMTGIGPCRSHVCWVLGDLVSFDDCGGQSGWYDSAHCREGEGQQTSGTALGGKGLTYLSSYDICISSPRS